MDCAAIDEEILNSPSSSKKMLIDGLNRDVKPLSVIIDDDEKIKLVCSFSYFINFLPIYPLLL